MALINTLRQKMGKIVVIVVAFSMFAFILTDLLNTNSVLLGGSNDIGEISGESISYTQFQNKVDELATNFSLNMGRNPLSEELDQIRQQAWQAFIVENIFEKEYQNLGIEVTDTEVVDMVQGTNINPQIRQFFTDPNTGQFDRQNVVTFLQNLNNAQPAQRASWFAFESTLSPSRKLVKYENLLELSKFANKYEAQQEYLETATLTVDYLYVPFFSLSDTLVEASDEELRDYIDENSEEYQREASKDASYVEFPITPSADDSLFVIEEVAKLVEDLKNARDDSVFTSINSDGLTPYGTYKPNNFPAFLEGDNVELIEGFVSEPQLSGNSYTFFKISAINDGDEAFVKASHILFKPDDESDQAKQAARNEARRVLREIRNGADFSDMASQYGTDATAARGGDLGWIGETGSYVQEFKDAIFAFRGTGLLRDVVETEFGYHIIEVTEPKTTKVYKIATIEKELFVSDRTLNETYRQADLFASQINSSGDFFDKAEELGLAVRNASKVQKNDKRLGSLSNARSIVFWLFNTADIGDVSDVFELDDKYVVAVQTSEQKEGTANLEDVRSQVSRKVLDKKKADIIISQLDGLEGSYEDIQTAYGDGARVSSGDITLSTNSFPGVGFAPEAIGTAFSLEEGESTLPFVTQNGVLMLTVTAKNILEDLADYEAYRPVVVNNTRSVRRREEPFTFQNIYDALLEYADIEDERYKYY